MEAAKNSTTKEVKDSTKIKAVVPRDVHEILDLLKTCANLLYAIFRNQTPLLLNERKIIRSLYVYKLGSIKCLSK